MDDNNNREIKRYRINQIFDDKNQNEFYVDIIIDASPIRAKLADISAAGIGYEIESKDFTELEKRENAVVELKIYSPDHIINAGAKKIWSIIIESDSRETLKGGMMFTSLSSGEMQKLSNLINSFGKKSS